eukprot:9774557-Prorocentrum_lima.AAC.1
MSKGHCNPKSAGRVAMLVAPLAFLVEKLGLHLHVNVPLELPEQHVKVEQQEILGWATLDGETVVEGPEPGRELSRELSLKLQHPTQE